MPNSPGFSVRAVATIILLGVAGLSNIVSYPSTRDAVSAQSPPVADFLLTNVRLFDGERVHGRTQVAVQGGVIRAIGPDLSAWRRLPAVDGTGGTLMPGLIDTHTHVRDAEELRQALRFGVTTMLDMGASEALPPERLFSLRTAARTDLTMADLRAAGYMAIPSGAPLPTPTVSGVDQAKQFVAARRDEGSDYLKIYLAGVRSAQMRVPGLDQATVTALVQAAHTAGMLAIAHVETLEDVNTALSASVDGLAHVWRRGGASDAISRRVAERGVFVTATLAIPDGYLRPEARTSLIADDRFRGVISDSLMAQLRRPVQPRTTGDGVQELKASFHEHLVAVQALRAAGVRLLVGTDASRNNIAVHGITAHRELEVLVKMAGLQPVEALRAATANAADAFRLSDRGRIAVGQRADLILVRGDPTTDILATRDIARVWRSGVEVDRRVSAR